MKLGYGISLAGSNQRSFGGISYDADALAYFATAGITDATAKTQINDFVVGMKGIGIWSNMVCWPLRSSQNAGTGTTVYSLGGLGTYNATIAGGASWGSGGIALTSSTSIDATAPYGTTAGSLIGVSTINTLAREYAMLRNSPAGMGFFSPYSDNTFYFDYRESTNRLSVSSGISAGVIFMLSGYSSASGSQIYRNTTSLASNATAANGTGNTARVFESFTTASQVASFAMLIQSDARANHSSIYNTIKTSLCSGLGLP